MERRQYGGRPFGHCSPICTSKLLIRLGFKDRARHIAWATS